MIITGLALFLPFLVRADAPPPPPFTVYVNYQGQKLKDANFSAEILKCDTEKSAVDASIPSQLQISEYDSAKSCTWEPSISSYNRNGSNNNYLSNCTLSQCGFDWTLGEFKIATYIPSLNKTFISNEVTRAYSGYYGFNTIKYYQLDLTKSGGAKLSESSPQGKDIGNSIDNNNNGSANHYDMASLVTNTKAFMILMIISLLATLVLEIITALIFAFIKKAPKRILLGVLIGNIISVPLLWVLVSRFYSTLIPAEILVVIFEAWIIKYFSRQKLSWKACLLLSFIMNLVSFIFGPIIVSFL